MAEGGKWSRSFKDSFSKASGDADESFCDPCKSEDNYIAVEGFCPVCNEYLCENCLRVHRKQKITRAHAILDKKQMPSGGQGSASNQLDMCVEVCKTHHPEIIRFYCKSHDQAGCGDCMTLNHKTCSRERVQDISGGFQKTKEFQDIEKKLQRIHQELEKMDGQLDDKLNNLDTTYNNILQKIAKVRKQINEYLDQTEKKIKEKAAQIKKADEAELKTFQTEHQAMKTEIEVMLKALHDSNTNLTSLFVISKQAKHRLVTMEKDINTIQKSQHTKYEFLISNEIENLISTNAPFGKLSRQSQTSRGMTAKQDQKTPRAPTVDSTATYNRSFNVNGKTEKNGCYITDCTLLSPDRLVVTDLNNNNVKLIDLNNNTVISSYSTSSRPREVTTLNTNTIAVTLPVEGKIQVLNVTSTFTLQREIKVDYQCYGIAYKDGKFAVSYTNSCRVDVLDIQGNILHTIKPQQDNNNILQDPAYITFGQDMNTVIVSDWGTNKVSVVTFRGQILRTYAHDTLRDPEGIVMTADGVLYVCSWRNGCIHVVSPDFKTSRIIINNDGHVEYPTGITYCEINHRLYISNFESGGEDLNNQIQVYDVKVPV